MEAGAGVKSRVRYGNLTVKKSKNKGGDAGGQDRGGDHEIPLGTQASCYRAGFTGRLSGDDTHWEGMVQRDASLLRNIHEAETKRLRGRNGRQKFLNESRSCWSYSAVQGIAAQEAKVREYQKFTEPCPNSKDHGGVGGALIRRSWNRQTARSGSARNLAKKGHRIA